jgi:hypothetical protein
MKHLSAIISLLILQGCASSMSPSTFIVELPNATVSRYIDKAEYADKEANGECTLRVTNRKYVAPVGMTVHGDVRNGARGVDEWVGADSGNAYTINNFEWIIVDDEGTTQLTIYFDTLLCK